MRTGLCIGAPASGSLDVRWTARLGSSKRSVGPILRLGAVPGTSTSLRCRFSSRRGVASGAPHLSAKRFGVGWRALMPAGAHPCWAVHLRGKAGDAAVRLLFCPLWARLATFFPSEKLASASMVNSSGSPLAVAWPSAPILLACVAHVAKRGFLCASLARRATPGNLHSGRFCGSPFGYHPGVRLTPWALRGLSFRRVPPP